MGLKTSLEGSIKTLSPKSLRPFFLNLYCVTLDGFDLAGGRRDAMTPPRRLLRIATDQDRDKGQDIIVASRIA
jgi:hypothetical protein